MEDCRVVELRHRSEPAEFPGELHECEIPPDKGETPAANSIVLSFFFLGWIILSRWHTGIQERGDEDCNKRGI